MNLSSNSTTSTSIFNELKVTQLTCFNETAVVLFRRTLYALVKSKMIARTRYEK